MSLNKPHKIEKPKANKRVARPKQTGFSSPATHYNEPRIDLNEVLVGNTEATFYVRVKDDGHKDLGIEKADVLIVDKSIVPKKDQLALVTCDGSFKIIRLDNNTYEALQIWGTISYIIKSVL